MRSQRRKKRRGKENRAGKVRGASYVEAEGVGTYGIRELERESTLLSFAFLPKAPTHLTRDTRTSRILTRSICTAPTNPPRRNLVPDPAGYLVASAEKNLNGKCIALARAGEWADDDEQSAGNYGNESMDFVPANFRKFFPL